MSGQPQLFLIKGGRAHARGRLPSFVGAHGKPLRYDVRLRPPEFSEARLHSIVDGELTSSFLCYARPDRDLNKPTEERAEHRLEVFGGDGTKGARQFGSFGPHSHDDRGNVVREYRWPGRSPVDVPLADLPLSTKAEVLALVAAFDARAEALGFVPVPHTTLGETIPRFAFDLTDDMDFDGNSLDELEDVYYAARHSLDYSNRITSSFLGHGTNASKCIIGWSDFHRCLTVHNFETGTTHLPKSVLPESFTTAGVPPLWLPESFGALPPLPDNIAALVLQSPAEGE